MSRRKQANPKSLRVSIDSMQAIFGEDANLKENEHSDTVLNPQEQLASILFKNMTNQSDLNENRKIYQFAKLAMDYFGNANREIKNEHDEADKAAKSRSRSSSQSSDFIDVTTVSEEKNPLAESKKSQRKRFNANCQNASQSSIVINGKRYYPLKFTCENCGLRYSDQSTLDTHKINYCTKKNVSKESSNEESSSPETSPTSSRSSTPFNKSQASEDASKVQLLKSVMYQCNMCTFQSDKISIMNRHSRIHLPQKRKQMEESVQAKIEIGDESVESQRSYCQECDIHFSSLKTFLHHRNNYCQKYKTIESVVPVPIGPSTSTTVEPAKSQVNSNVMTPQPIRMGDLVYVPYYKINEKMDATATTPLKPSEEIDEAPLDLSIKKNNVNQQQGFQSVFRNPVAKFPFTIYPNLIGMSSIVPGPIKKTDSSIETDQVKNKVSTELKKSSTISANITSFLIQHSLVKKTLVELYGDDFELFNMNDEIDESLAFNSKLNGISKNFYMCTACGYRGNTSRGVKQHGKLHLASDEHFAIINVTDCKPLLVYSSLNDCDMVKIMGKRNNSEMIDEEAKFSANSKKPRHFEFMDETNDINKSQNYCSKCDIKFNHLKSFLVHKKSYCKD